jgi:alkanesulfonate monooxygenase SsuD/methylene tetrahydromethanopterin reductase-like flavin-dependent oxidoreductase (luciferase family)
MRHGFVIPGGSAPEQLELAVLAEQSGWDGVFVWESGYAVDPWALLSAVAMRTSTVRLGTMLTPLPWRRPWKLAAQVATLDQLSGGRAIVTVGLGAVDTGLGTYGETTDLATRAALLDEGIDLLRALWSGEAAFHGTHHRIDLTTSMIPRVEPVQDRIPIWVVGAHGSERSMTRVLRCDGLVPTITGPEGGRQPTPDEVLEMLRWLDDHGGRPAGFDVVVEGETDPGDVSPVRPWEPSATWWLETRWTSDDPNAARKRIGAGPPAA